MKVDAEYMTLYVTHNVYVTIKRIFFYIGIRLLLKWVEMGVEG